MYSMRFQRFNDVSTFIKSLRAENKSILFESCYNQQSNPLKVKISDSQAL